MKKFSLLFLFSFFYCFSTIELTADFQLNRALSQKTVFNNTSIIPIFKLLSSYFNKDLYKDNVYSDLEKINILKKVLKHVPNFDFLKKVLKEYILKSDEKELREARQKGFQESTIQRMIRLFNFIQQNSRTLISYSQMLNNNNDDLKSAIDKALSAMDDNNIQESIKFIKEAEEILEKDEIRYPFFATENHAFNVYSALSSALKKDIYTVIEFILKNKLARFYVKNVDGYLEPNLALLVLLAAKVPNLKNYIEDNLNRIFFNVYTKAIFKKEGLKYKTYSDIPLVISSDKDMGLEGFDGVIIINPLLLAIDKQLKDIAQKLISFGFRVYDYDLIKKYYNFKSLKKLNLGSSYVLNEAVKKGAKEDVKYLLLNGAVIDKSKFDYQTDDPEIQKMLDKILYVSQGSLFGAVRSGDEDRVRALLALGVKPDEIINKLDEKGLIAKITSNQDILSGLNLDYYVIVDPITKKITFGQRDNKKRSLKVDDDNVADTSAAKRHHD